MKRGFVKPVAPRPPSAVQIVELIEVEFTLGTGVDESDPCRRVVQYWSKDGVLLATLDDWAKQQETV